MSTFKVGDKVRCINNREIEELASIGDVVVVKEFKPQFFTVVGRPYLSRDAIIVDYRGNKWVCFSATRFELVKPVTNESTVRNNISAIQSLADKIPSFA